MNRKCPSLQYLHDRDKWQTLPIHDAQFKLISCEFFNLLQINSLTIDTAPPFFLISVYQSLDVADFFFFKYSFFSLSSNPANKTIYFPECLHTLLQCIY